MTLTDFDTLDALRRMGADDLAGMLEGILPEAEAEGEPAEPRYLHDDEAPQCSTCSRQRRTVVMLWDAQDEMWVCPRCEGFGL